MSNNNLLLPLIAPRKHHAVRALGEAVSGVVQPRHALKHQAPVTPARLVAHPFRPLGCACVPIPQNCMNPATRAPSTTTRVRASGAIEGGAPAKARATGDQAPTL